MDKNIIYNADCLDPVEGMARLPDNSVDLIVVDPPYNIKKAVWDKWKTVSDYVDWMGLIFTQCRRVLKDNGSFYFFHNDFLQIVELQNWINKNTNFVFRQLIVWNKKYEGVWNEGYLQGFIEPKGLRNYQKMCEYCLFYTLQDETGLSAVMLDVNNFSALRRYFKGLQEYIGLSLIKINNKLGHRKAEHAFYWKATQWDMPTKETYKQLVDVFCIDKWDDYREYESLRNEYESLRNEYESLRYTFNNQKTHHSVWQYPIQKQNGHRTPKPVELIENIILHSSNEGDTVLDCFIGSGTTAIACMRTGRNYIGWEKDSDYYKIIQDRIQKEIECFSLFNK